MRRRRLWILGLASVALTFASPRLPRQAVQAEPAPVDFYELLGVGPEATVQEIRSAYRQAARLSHPDFFRTKPKEEREEAQERFTQVNKAFEVLTHPEKRQAYDLRGLAGLADFEFNGERIIMPPPWRVRVGYTGHHFWKMREYFLGFMLETLPDVSYEAIDGAYAKATKDPVGVGQAILVDRCTEKRAKDVVEALQEYGIVCMAEEVPDEELRDDEDEEEPVVRTNGVAKPSTAPVSHTPPVKDSPKVAEAAAVQSPTKAPPVTPKNQPTPVMQTPVTPPVTQQPPVTPQPPVTQPPMTPAAKPPSPAKQPTVTQRPQTPTEGPAPAERQPERPWRWPHSARTPPGYQGSEHIFRRR